MPKYYVEIQINYDGDIEASSEAEATEIAWSAYYGEDALLEYASVENITVEELKEEDDEDEEGDE